MVFESIFVKIDPEIAKHMPTKSLSCDNNRTIEIYFASEYGLYIINLKVRKFQQSQLLSLAVISNH